MSYTENLKRIGFLKGTNLVRLKQYCQEITSLTKPSTSSYIVGNRQEIWFEKGFKLSKQVEVYEAKHDQKFYELGQKLFPGNHACLFLKYSHGSYIKPHRDHTATEAKVVQINIGCEIKLTVEKQIHLIKDGEAIEFNSKLLHSTSPAPNQRWVVSWRRIKSEYLNPQLSLFQ